MTEIKRGTGNGQGSCYGCEQKKWNRSWVNLLYEYEDKLWCEDCLIARFHKENQELKKQLEYLRNGEYLNQLKFERNVLKDVVNKGEVSEEDKQFIDCTHRNTELLAQQKEFIEWLENWFKILKEQFKGMRGVNAAYQRLIIDTVNETLSKYKEIIGDKKESDIDEC